MRNEEKKKYVKLMAFGLSIFLAGGLTIVTVRASAGYTIPTALRSWYYAGVGFNFIGATLVCITLMAGALLEEKFNQYVRLGMLVAAGLILALLTYIIIGTGVVS